jgi:hypothetical protein
VLKCGVEFVVRWGDAVIYDVSVCMCISVSLELHYDRWLSECDVSM